MNVRLSHALGFGAGGIRRTFGLSASPPEAMRRSSESVSSSIGASRRSITWAGFPSRRSASSLMAARSPSSAFSANFSAILLLRVRFYSRCSWADR